MKKATSILLLFCLVLTFAACSSDKGAANYTGGETVGGDLAGNGGARIFTPRQIPLPDADSRAMRAVKAGDRIFMHAQAGDTNCFYFIGADNSPEKAAALENTVIAIDGDAAGNAYVLSMEPEGAYVLTRIGTSMELSRSTLDFLSETEDTVRDITVTEQGYLLETFNKILCYDLSGQYIGALGPFDGAFDLIKNGSEVILVIPSDSNTRFNVLNPAFEIAATYDIPQSLSGISPGSQEGHVFACNSGILYDVDFTTGERRGYANIYASGDGGNFIYLTDDSYFSLENDGEIAIYSLTGAGESGEMKTLTLATYAHEDYEIYDLLEAVRRFNERSTAYRIDVANYGMYDDNGDERSGLQRLYADITAGNTPDIYDLSCLSYRSFYKSGLLEDLYPYFRSSDSVSLDELTSSVVEALDYDGALYALVPAYTIVTMYGPSSVADSDAWGPEAFAAIANTTEMDLLGREVTKTEFLKYLLTFTGREYIDIEEASCDFVNSSFPAMLSVAAMLPDSYDSSNVSSDNWGLIFTGQQLFTISTTANIIAGLCFADGAYCGNAAALGFPSGNNGIAMTPYMNLGMSSGSSGKDGVWSFFEYLLSEEYQNDINKTLPIREAALQAKLDAWLEKASETSNVTGFADNMPVSMPYGPVTPALKEEALDIIGRIDCVDSCDDALYELVLREATPFFQGGLTAEQAAENIQSKVSIYLSEHY